jgi:hypothetical protein
MTLLELYEDVYRRLTEYAPLTDLLKGERVYDFEPDTEVPGPYIAIGDTHEVEGRTLSDDERKVFIRLHIWSSYHGRKEIVQIEREVESALTGETSGSDGYLFESFQIILDGSGWMHGVVVFRTHMDK